VVVASGELQVFVSVLHPRNAEPLFQPSSHQQLDTNSDNQSLNALSCLWNFTLSLYLCSTLINKQRDSLLNSTFLPIIRDYKDWVPKDLVAVANLKESVLVVYIKTHW
jgi:hypothetical protein